MNRYSEQLKKQEHKLKVIQSSSGMSGPYAFEAPKGLLSLTQQSYGMLEAMCEHMYNTPKRRWVSCGSSELTLKDEEELANDAESAWGSSIQAPLAGIHGLHLPSMCGHSA